jgi:hypothetical protein
MPERMDRLLLIFALGYWLRAGLRAQQQYRPSMWCGSNRASACSVFTIGRLMRDRRKATAATAVAAALAAIAAASPNRG